MGLTGTSMQPVTIALEKAGKKFGREWIFRRLDYSIAPGEKLAILGGNGSGKSTLLQVFSGFVTLNEGTLSYKKGEQKLDQDQIPNFISFASPYIQVPEDLTALELIAHLGHYKPYLPDHNPERVITVARLDHVSHKLIKHFSSGMKQRLKLALAFMADAPILCLDEPTSNLDHAAITWYQQMIDEYAHNRTVIVCSNSVEDEYRFCKERLRLEDYKS